MCSPVSLDSMDGSVSTLAPLFAAAFATHQNWQTFLVGLAASIGAGISMGFAEALSDDGSLTGRGSPWLRGAASGIMTALGGLGHSLPYLVPDSVPNAFWIATAIAGVVVFFELWAIAFIRSRYMDTPFLQAVFQIVLGGVIVLGVGIFDRGVVAFRFDALSSRELEATPGSSPRACFARNALAPVQTADLRKEHVLP